MKEAKIFTALAVSLALLSCSREADRPLGGQITVVAGEPAVRTALNGPASGPFTTTWTKGDAIRLWRSAGEECSDAVSSALEEDCTTASFSVNMPSLSGEQVFTAVYPASAVSEKSGVQVISIPSEQTSAGGTFDPAADIMIAGPATRTGSVTLLPMQFCRLGSIIRLEIGGLEAGDKVHRVDISSSTSPAGEFSWDPVAGEAARRSEGVGTLKVTCGDNVVLARVMGGTYRDLCFTVTTDSGSYVKEVGKTVTLEENTVNCFSTVIDKTDVVKGTESNPYLISTVEDLLKMQDRLVYGKITYFKLTADLDMSGVSSWPVLNIRAGSGTDEIQYSQGIDFNGDGHTISNFTANQGNNYAGFVGVLYGKVHDLKFVNPVVSGQKATGVVCGYAGTGTYPADIENVEIVGGRVTQYGNAHTGLVFGTNSVPGKYRNIKADGLVTMAASAPLKRNASASGGIAGSSMASTFEDCRFTGKIDGARHCGGIVGYERSVGASFARCSVEAEMILKDYTDDLSEDAGGLIGYLEGGSITDCFSTGSITLTGQICGGIVGEISNLTTIRNCWSSMNLKAARVAGGIAGRACHGKWDITLTKDLDLCNCIYWGANIDVQPAGTGNGSSGAIVGFTALTNTVAGCWRNPSLSFVTGNPHNFIADQPDGCGTWVKGETPQVGTGTAPQQYLFPYWGKASDMGGVSATVTGKNLGWDTSVWDLSGNEPKLK